MDSGARTDLEEELEAVRQANREFYRAIESLDPERMDRVWLDSPNVQCVHPGWGALTGRETVLESWRRIFAHTSYIEFEVQNEVIWIENGLAAVSNTEVMRSASQGQTLSGSVHATNVYRKEAGRWRLVIHHAS